MLWWSSDEGRRKNWSSLSYPGRKKHPSGTNLENRTPTTFLKTPKDHYKRIYFIAMDTVTQCIATRFEQEDFKLFMNIQELLLKSFASERCDTELADPKWWSGGFFQVKRTTFIFTTDSRVNGVLDSRIWPGSGRVFSGFGIWPKYGAGIGKTINISTESEIWLFPGKRDSPKTGHGMRDLFLRVGRECRKPSRPTGSSGQSKSTRRALSGVSFQTKHLIGCLVNRC